MESALPLSESNIDLTTPFHPAVLTQQEIVRAATNAPALSEDEFVLGGKTFKILDLSYDDYIRFVALLEPLINSVVSGAAKRAAVDAIPDNVIPLSEFGIRDLVKACIGNLPEMTCIVCRQTDPTMTVDKVKKVAKSPFELSKIVIKQIARNNIIQDFTDFFEQILPLLKASQLSQ